MVKWSNGQMVKLSNGRMVKWSNGQMVKWSNGQMVEWSNCQMVKWSNGQMVKWSNGRMVKWFQGRAPCVEASASVAGGVSSTCGGASSSAVLRDALSEVAWMVSSVQADAAKAGNASSSDELLGLEVTTGGAASALFAIGAANANAAAGAASSATTNNATTAASALKGLAEAARNSTRALMIAHLGAAVPGERPVAVSSAKMSYSARRLGVGEEAKGGGAAAASSSLAPLTQLAQTATGALDALPGEALALAAAADDGNSTTSTEAAAADLLFVSGSDDTHADGRGPSRVSGGAGYELNLGSPMTGLKGKASGFKSLKDSTEQNLM